MLRVEEGIRQKQKTHLKGSCSNPGERGEWPGHRGDKSSHSA